MHKIQCVSLPRSGHNLLVSHLQKYFSSNQICLPISKRPKSLFGRKPHSSAPKEINTNNALFHYCEYYYSCRKTPCENPANTLQKSHDFDLKLPVHHQQRYIIQHRIPLGLLISWFELRLPRKRENDSAPGFIDFVNRNRSYLDQFREKWIESSIPHRLLIDYDDYLQSPVEWLSRVVTFFDEEIEPDTIRIQEIVRDVRPAKNNKRFRFYDAVTDLQLERSLARST